MADDNSEIQRALGRIEGKLDSIQQGQAGQGVRLDAVEQRLRHVETHAARAGAVSGALIAVGTALAIEMLKRAVL